MLTDFIQKYEASSSAKTGFVVSVVLDRRGILRASSLKMKLGKDICNHCIPEIHQDPFLLMHQDPGSIGGGKRFILCTSSAGSFYVTVIAERFLDGSTPKRAAVEIKFIPEEKRE